MEIVGIFGQSPRPPICQKEEYRRAQSRTAKYQHLAFEERLSDPYVT